VADQFPDATKKVLSLAAQAVLDAAFPAYDDETLYVATGEQHAGKIAAAALRCRCSPWQLQRIDGTPRHRHRTGGHPLNPRLITLRRPPPRLLVPTRELQSAALAFPEE